MPTTLMVGERIGRLVVVGKLARRGKNGSWLWKCRCDCGVVTARQAIDLNRSKKLGATASCGCRLMEIRRTRAYRGKPIDRSRSARRFSGNPGCHEEWEEICGILGGWDL